MKTEHAAMGPRLRELRVDAGISQAVAAARLAISPAYLSLVEKGKRPAPMPLLVRALALYGVAMEAFLASLGEGRIDAELAKLLDEPLLRSLSLTRRDLSAISGEPKFVATITALFQLYKNARRELDGGTVDASTSAGPHREVERYVESEQNFFPEVEERATAFRRDEGVAGRPRASDFVRVLRERFDLDVRSDLSDAGALLRLDAAANVLSIAPALTEPRLSFELARALALRTFATEGLVESRLAAFEAIHDESRSLLRHALADSFAAACLVPRREFHGEATRTRFDVEWLASRFEVSYELVAERLTSLAAGDTRGVPLHFVKADAAGNVSKRFVADGLRGSLDHGGCPKLAVHSAFLSPGLLRRQFSRFPDGETFFCFARVAAHSFGPDGLVAHSIALGCAASDAKRFAYADELGRDVERVAVSVGPTCRACERVDCAMRSAPSVKQVFRVDDSVRHSSEFSQANVPAGPKRTRTP